MIAAYLAIFMTAFVGFDLHQNGLIAAVLAAHFIIFSLGTFMYSITNRESLSESESWSFLPVLLIFYAMEYHFIDLMYPGLAPWISLGFAGLLIGLYLSAKSYFSDSLGSLPMLLAFVTIVCFHSVYIELLPGDIRPWLFILITLGIAVYPLKEPLQDSGFSSGPAMIIPALAVLAIVVLEYLDISIHLLNEDNPYWLGVSFAAFTSIWALLIMKDDSTGPRKTYGHLLLGSAHLLAILGFYRLTDGSGSLALSACWLLYAVCVMIFAFVRKDEVMAKSALFVLSFAAGKALLYDAASAPTVVRIFCLLLTGAVLYGSGFLMRKITNWQRQ
jgi:hypothetical protein